MPWGVVGAVGGALIASDSSRKAANTQADAANNANAAESSQYNQTRADNLPWMTRGNLAGDKLNSLLGLGGGTSPTADGNLGFGNEQVQSIDPNYGSLLRRFSQSDLSADPVYQNGLQFGLDQGVGALNRQAAASGGLLSGAALKAVTRFGNDYGSTKANESYNRYTTDQNNQYNKLAGVAGTGQVANAQVSASGQNAANQIGANTIGAGNARGSGYIANGNALTGAIGSGVNAYNQYNALNPSYTPNSGGVNTGFGAGVNYTGGTNDYSMWE